MPAKTLRIGAPFVAVGMVDKGVMLLETNGMAKTARKSLF